MIEMYEFLFFFLRQRDKHRKGRGFYRKFLNFREICIRGLIYTDVFLLN